MLRFDVVGTLTGARFRTGAPEVAMVETEQGLLVINQTGGETLSVSLSAGQMAQVAGFSVHGPDRIALTVGGYEGALPRPTIDAARLAGAAGQSITAHLSLSGGFLSQVELMGLTVGGTALVYAARANGHGIEWFRPQQGGLDPAGRLVDPSLSLGAVSALASATVGMSQVLLAGSATASTVTVLRIGADGGLSPLFRIGPADGLPIQTISALRVVQAGGETWVIVGAAESSSLTVLRMGADGVLSIRDQVVDDLGTRFQAVTALDVVTRGAEVFVIAAGADDGVTLFTLLPDGTLQFLDTIADATATRLADVSALKARIMGDEIQILVSSASEAGMTLLRVALGGRGATGMPTPRDDIIPDGIGADTLTGGAGADVFVFRSDRARDVVSDFDPARDRLDFSRWAFFRDAGQIAVTPTDTGAILTFWDECWTCVPVAA